MVTSPTPADHLEWCGFVESKVRYLVSNLERNQYISLAHVNPKCFERAKPATTANGDKSISDPSTTPTAAESTSECSMWFIGLEFRKMENLKVDLTENIQNFTNLVHKHASSISFNKTGMDFEVRHVRRKQLNTYLDKDILNVERKKRDASALTTTSSRKHAAAAAAAAATETSSTNETQEQEQPQPTQNDSPEPAKRQKVR